MPAVTKITDALSFRISRLAAINERSGSVHFQKAFGLRLNEWRVLGLAHAGNPIPFALIHATLLVDKGQLSRIVRSLVDRGLLEAHVCATDARQTEIYTTPEGSALHDRVLAFTIERNATMTAVLSEEEIDVFRQLLDRLLVHTEALLAENLRNQ